MTRRLKAFGLALVAVFALSALAASAASAHVFMSEFNVSAVTLHGTQETAIVTRLTAGSPATECTKTTFHGTMTTSPTNTMTLHPEYTGCTFLGLSAPIDVPASCNYVLSGATPEANMATVALNCAMGEPIKLTAPGCTVEFGDTHPANTARNQALNGVRYTNIGSGTTREVTVTWTVNNMASNVSGSFCALGGISTGTHTTGTYEGSLVVTGTVAGAHVGVTIE